MRNYAFVASEECKPASEFIENLLNDPMTIAYGAPVDDIIEGWLKTHMKACEKCRDAFGEANMP